VSRKVETYVSAGTSPRQVSSAFLHSDFVQVPAYASALAAHPSSVMVRDRVMPSALTFQM